MIRLVSFSNTNASLVIRYEGNLIILKVKICVLKQILNFS